MADELILDLVNYRDRTGAYVPPSRYKVIVDDVEKTEAQESKNEMVNLWLRILEGDHKDEVLVDRLVNTPNSMFRFVGFLQAIGVKTPKSKLKINPYQFKGKVLEVDVDDGEYRGRIKTEVRGYMRATGPGPATDVADLPGTDDLSAFTGEAQDEAAAKEAAPEAPAATNPTEAAAPAADEIELDSIDLG